MQGKKFLIALKADYIQQKNLDKTPTREPTTEPVTEPEVGTEPAKATKSIESKKTTKVKTKHIFLH